MEDTPRVISVFSSFSLSDFLFLAQAAYRTLEISLISITIGTILGIFFGWCLHSSKVVANVSIGFILDVFRSVPLIIQLVLFYNLFPIIGLRVSPFAAGTIVLSFYTAALVANVVRSGIESVPQFTRRASRSLGLSYWQDLKHIVWPIGLRAVLPAWVGVALGVLKDSALVSVLGYVELLKASQRLITKTQEPLIVLIAAGTFYFILSFSLARASHHFEAKWNT